MENGELEPSKLGKVKESRENKRDLSKKLKNLSVNTQISKNS